ncbi:MAG TPA: hypothetical protein VEZ71_12920, partial [Archangium sp.]|nr:hypothetical protein [Archangium sp.]
MILLRKTFGAAALVTAAAVLAPGCGEPQVIMGKQDAGAPPGCTGVCSEDGGPRPDAGFPSDGGS